VTDTPSTEASAVARIVSGISTLDPLAWNLCAGAENPFLDHAFLSALETSQSVGAGTGWHSSPIVITSPSGGVVGALPAYLKSHSQGEYVFDHGWADAWHRAGGHYYPKLQIAVPFTPVQGSRILTSDPEIAVQLLEAAEAIVAQNGLSSAHATFIEPAQCDWFRKAGWLLREGIQYHWFNNGYATFEDFLGALSSRKRKAIRRERAAAQAAVTITHVTGQDITEAHWDSFWTFYQDTGARKWGQPYLTRTFFSEIGRTMRDRLILVLAERDGRAVAGALNLIGTEALYGRYWGCTEDIPFLHFELCYYQAIDAAIARGLSRVEAGAQGEHKLARGYVAVPTWSAHYIPDLGFRDAVSDFLERERSAVEQDIAYLGALTPFKKQT
jgi:uncharacterized protein